VTRLGPRDLVAAWALVRAGTVDVFAPGALALLSALPGWSALGLPGRSRENDAIVTLLDALRAFALRELSEGESHATAELVATLPAVDRNVLATGDVVRTLLGGAKRSILVVGFELNEPTMKRLLFRRGLDGVDVTIVADRNRGSARELLKDWPAAARPLRAMENVEPAAVVPGLLHAKVIVADRATALMGSANFTSGGIRNNLEIGLRVSGKPVDELLRTMERLEKLGWIVPVEV
jgi:phosphatidylserine/phosphatidylglycerophosphate/cardiolipin synthase-like enzyme